MSKLLLIDGSGFLWRTFHAVKPRSRRDGTPINAIEGVISLVLRPIIERNDATHVAVVLDDDGHRTFRNNIHPEYKANRPPPPPDLLAQRPIMAEAVRAYGFAFLQIPGFEADDVLATLARMGEEDGHRVIISTSDKDLMQLVRPGVVIYNQQTKAMIREEQVIEKFGVPPGRVVDVQSLSGDSVDNVPGVPSIGAKSAATLVTEYGDLEGVLAAAADGRIKRNGWRENLVAHAADARLSQQLVRLREDVDVGIGLDDLRVGAPPDAIADFLIANDLPRNLRPSMCRRLPDWRPAPWPTDVAAA